MVENNMSRYARHAVCPHCGGDLEIQMQVEISEVAIPADRDWKRGLSEEQLSVVAMAQDTGLLDSFKAVVEHAKLENRPRSVERFFLTFLKLSAQKLVPPFAIQHFSRVTPGRLSFWASEGIMAVCSDGAIRCFVPQDLICGRNVKNTNGNGSGLRVKAEPHILDEWWRTRFGYVAGQGAMLDALKVKSVGELARPGVN